MSVRTRAVIREMSVSLGDAVGGSGHSTRYRRGCELELTTVDGVVGRGEASPLPRFSSESYEQARDELSGIGDLDLDLASKPGDCQQFVSSVVARAGCTLPSARCALEGALLDLVAQRLQLSVANLIAEMVNAVDVRAPSPLQSLGLSAVLTARELPSLLNSARSAVAQGFETLKLKMGPAAEFEREFHLIESLRASLDSSVRLRLDPNQAWSLQVLSRNLERLATLAPEFVEEPAAFVDLLRMGPSPVPLAIDESLRDEATLEIVAEHHARLKLSTLVVKPALLGLMRAIGIAEYGRRLGLDIVVTHLFDGPIGLATAASLALALGSRQTAQGLAPHAGLQLSPNRRVLGIASGRLEAVHRSGLPLGTFEHTAC
jgi:L-Ala-D/L-Glu epimerase